MNDGIDFEIKNVRCIEQASLSIRMGRLTTIVGRNNSGKTTLLDALVKVLRSLPGAPEQQFSTDYYRELDGRLRRPEATLRFPSAWLRKSVLTEPAPLQLRFIGSRLETAIDASRPEIARWLPTYFAVEFPNQTTTLLISKGLQISSDLARDDVPYFEYNGDAFQGVLSTEIGPAIAHSPMQKGHARVFTSTGSWQNPFLSSLSSFAGRVYYLSAKRILNFTPATQDLNLPTDEAPNTGVLRRLHVKGEYWKPLCAALGLIFDDVVDIIFGEVGESTAPHARLLHGATVPFERMGYGFRNAAAILAAVCAAPPGAIVVVDEPEQGLNQSCQRAFASVLGEIRDDVALVLATQSESFCRGISSDTIHLAVRKRGTTTISACDLSKDVDRRALAQAMGINPLLLLDDAKVIYVEGTSDEKIIDDWLELHWGPAKKNCIVQSLGGGDKVNENFARPMFKTFKDQIFFIIDADGESNLKPRSSQTLKRLAWIQELGCRHYVLKRRELENYIGLKTLSQAASVNETELKVLVTDEHWADLKAAIKKISKTGIYEETRVTVKGYELLSDRHNLFASETAEILAALSAFAGS